MSLSTQTPDKHFTCFTPSCLPAFCFVYFIYFLVTLGLRCHKQAFSNWGEQGLPFVAVRGLLIAVASLVAEHRLQARGPWLQGVGAVIVLAGSASGRSCSQCVESSRTRDRTCVPHIWQVDAYPLSHREVSFHLFVEITSMKLTGQDLVTNHWPLCSRGEDSAFSLLRPDFSLWLGTKILLQAASGQGDLRPALRLQILVGFRQRRDVSSGFLHDRQNLWLRGNPHKVKVVS